MSRATSVRRRQRVADSVAFFVGIVGAMAWVDVLWQRALVGAAAALLGSVLLRLVLRVPIWRSEPDDRPPNLPPYGTPPVSQR